MENVSAVAPLQFYQGLSYFDFAPYRVPVIRLFESESGRASTLRDEAVAAAAAETKANLAREQLEAEREPMAEAPDGPRPTLYTVPVRHLQATIAAGEAKEVAAGGKQSTAAEAAEFLAAAPVGVMSSSDEEEIDDDEEGQSQQMEEEEEEEDKMKKRNERAKKREKKKERDDEEPPFLFRSSPASPPARPRPNFTRSQSVAATSVGDLSPPPREQQPIPATPQRVPGTARGPNILHRPRTINGGGGGGGGGGGPLSKRANRGEDVPEPAATTGAGTPEPGRVGSPLAAQASLAATPPSAGVDVGPGGAGGGGGAAVVGDAAGDAAPHAIV